MIVLAVPALALAGFLVAGIQGTVNVTDPFSVTPSEFAMDLYAGQNGTVEVIITNDSPNSLTAYFSVNSTPEGLMFNGGLPASVLVPGLGSYNTTLVIEAPEDIVPGAYLLMIDVTRGSP